MAPESPDHEMDGEFSKPFSASLTQVALSVDFDEMALEWN